MMIAHKRAPKSECCPGNEGDAVEYVRADLVDEVKSAVTNAFGETPVACDSMLLVSVDKYDKLAAALNAIR